MIPDNTAIPVSRTVCISGLSPRPMAKSAAVITPPTSRIALILAVPIYYHQNC